MSILNDVQYDFNRIMKYIEELEQKLTSVSSEAYGLKRGDLIFIEYHSFMRNVLCTELVMLLRFEKESVWVRSQNGSDTYYDLNTCHIRSLTEKEKQQLDPKRNVPWGTRSGTVVYYKQEEEDRFRRIGVFVGFKGLKALVIPISCTGTLEPEAVCVDNTISVSLQGYQRSLFLEEEY